jgi:hypothetical protein
MCNQRNAKAKLGKTAPNSGSRQAKKASKSPMALMSRALQELPEEGQPLITTRILKQSRREQKSDIPIGITNEILYSPVVV